MPAPSAAAALGEPLANNRFLSSIFTVVVFNVTVLPCTVRSPATVKLFTETSLVARLANTLALV